MTSCILQRRDIVSSAVEPTDSDCEWPSDEEEEEDEKLAVSLTIFHS